MTEALELSLAQAIAEIREQRHPRAAVQRDFATKRVYQVGFTHGAEAVLWVLGYAGLLDDDVYLDSLDLADDGWVAKALVDSWERIVEAIPPEAPEPALEDAEHAFEAALERLDTLDSETDWIATAERAADQAHGKPLDDLTFEQLDTITSQMNDVADKLEVPVKGRRKSKRPKHLRSASDDGGLPTGRSSR